MIEPAGDFDAADVFLTRVVGAGFGDEDAIAGSEVLDGPGAHGLRGEIALEAGKEDGKRGEWLVLREQGGDFAEGLRVGDDNGRRGFEVLQRARQAAGGGHQRVGLSVDEIADGLDLRQDQSAARRLLVDGSHEEGEAARADEIGAEYIATGHYARTENAGLYKARSGNDQSYMLCRLLPEQVERLLLPLGEYEKSEVRAMADFFGIPVASKPDSMEICFIPDKDYVGWISRRAQVPGGGDFVFDGKVIGHHEGIHRWTVGQRIPGLYNERKLYVSEIRAETNEIILALWEDLFKNEVCIRDCNWLIPEPTEAIRGSIKVRHTKWECPECTVFPAEDGIVRVHTDDTVRAPARGQAAVIYCGERVLGGGYIV